ncbi:MAG: MipA/OmpV family protein [Pseudomonadota bacterium]
MQNRLIPLLGASLIAAGAVQAQEPPPGTVQLGAFYGLSNDPYVGDGRQAFPFPTIQYFGDGFNVGTRGASIDIVRENNLEIAGILRPRITGLEFHDVDELDGIERNLTLDLGVTGTYSYGLTFLRATALQEVTREHDGQEATFEIGQRVPAGAVFLEFSGGGIFRSADLNDHLYGVREKEARAGRPAYSPDGDLTPFVAASARLPLTETANAFVRARYEILSDAATDSPIIEEEERISIGFGVGFGF